MVTTVLVDPVPGMFAQAFQFDASPDRLGYRAEGRYDGDQSLNGRYPPVRARCASGAGFKVVGQFNR
ncbi:hypothetical protein Thiowin_00571 [Thiorhodovibrio winogradskyi]|uniref:Uncharacterized protein n=1 Tax=Thiorhodovibrio winogradskyi TaxID=77007 RepID=A0ABZ0S504_9GAMM